MRSGSSVPPRHPPVQVAWDGEVGALGGGHPQVGGAGVKDDLRQMLWGSIAGAHRAERMHSGWRSRWHK